ncbi:uncharacterized protein LOC129719626 [Wyeomyia smithii]|uniref:uncharacterized protein LOC129719626 n=1 Tax=Wyeomyia smithii TaxID=174621 RepID=UPI0024680D0F|nr:uncharacterized protein LOC129719626 [Wyeomyia smithii]
MENKSDTEMDEVSTTRLPDKRRQQLTTNTRTIANVDLNAYAEQQTADFSSTTTNSKDEIFVLNNEGMGTGLSLEPIVLSESADSITQNPAQVVYLQPEMVHDNTTDSAVATAVLQNLNLILANQSKIMQVMTKLMTAVEYMSVALSEGVAHQVPFVSTTGLEDTVDPIRSLEELNLLEESLKDDRVMQKYIRNMSFICGTSGKANGMDSCYKLVDFFLPFLLQCSWTGISRPTGMNQSGVNEPGKVTETSKIALKFFKRFRALFLK